MMLTKFMVLIAQLKLLSSQMLFFLLKTFTACLDRLAMRIRNELYTINWKAKSIFIQKMGSKYVFY